MVSMMSMAQGANIMLAIATLAHMFRQLIVLIFLILHFAIVMVVVIFVLLSGLWTQAAVRPNRRTRSLSLPSHDRPSIDRSIPSDGNLWIGHVGRIARYSTRRVNSASR